MSLWEKCLNCHTGPWTPPSWSKRQESAFTSCGALWERTCVPGYWWGYTAVMLASCRAHAPTVSKCGMTIAPHQTVKHPSGWWKLPNRSLALSCSPFRTCTIHAAWAEQKASSRMHPTLTMDFFLSSHLASVTGASAPTPAGSGGGCDSAELHTTALSITALITALSQYCYMCTAHSCTGWTAHVIQITMIHIVHTTNCTFYVYTLHTNLIYIYSPFQLLFTCISY